MLVLSVEGQNHQLYMASESSRTTRPKVHGDKIRLTARTSEMIDSLPHDRKKKVLAIRQKINAGKYGINEQLKVAADRLIEDLITKRIEENEFKSTTRCK